MDQLFCNEEIMHSLHLVINSISTFVILGSVCKSSYKVFKSKSCKDSDCLHSILKSKIIKSINTNGIDNKSIDNNNISNKYGITNIGNFWKSVILDCCNNTINHFRPIELYDETFPFILGLLNKPLIQKMYIEDFIKYRNVINYVDSDPNLGPKSDNNQDEESIIDQLGFHYEMGRDSRPFYICYDNNLLEFDIKNMERLTRIAIDAFNFDS